MQRPFKLRLVGFSDSVVTQRNFGKGRPVDSAEAIRPIKISIMGVDIRDNELFGTESLPVFRIILHCLEGSANSERSYALKQPTVSNVHRKTLSWAYHSRV
jgi:hypothetical protein